MTDQIDAIIFDMGGTLRRNFKRDETGRVEIVRRILDLLGSDASAVEFTRLLTTRDAAYDEWATRNLTELNEIDLWTKWMLPDWPVEKISKIAMDLNHIWRDAIATRIMYPETGEVILKLFRRGYRLALVSNTTSSIDAPRALEKERISGCFDTVILSCVVGKRKPGPDILLEAVERMGVRPDRCAYIGDRPEWDVVASRRAGFKRTVILRLPHKPLPASIPLEQTPDFFIDNLKELLGLFPARLKSRVKQKQTYGPVYDASLSTMWAKNNFPVLGDFFLATGRLGFLKMELNHQVDSGMLSSVDLSKYKISSIHEPCPADISMETLKKRDWMISSPDEECRQKGVAAIKRSIDLADALSVRTVVVHAGHVSLDMILEKKLRQLYLAGLKETAEYQETKRLKQERRLKLIAPCLEAVVKSLKELLHYASRYDVRLGLENRYHYFDIPTPDEMSALLALAEPDQLGFIYDVGHATVMDRLGFFPDDMWLKRFGGRILGAHLHDVIGLSDHHAPGLGDVNFLRLAEYLPKEAFRTIEVLSLNTPEQVKAGLKILVDTGCVNPFEEIKEDQDVKVV
jgi:HAD superfamily hydrolase (TIGR01549 family)